MIKYLSIFVFLYLLTGHVSAQSPYHISRKNNLITIGSGSIFLGASYFIERSKPPLTIDDVQALSLSKVPKFERFCVNYYSPRARTYSDIVLFSSLAFPALLALDKEIRSDFGQTSMIVTQNLLLSAGLVSLTKAIAQRPRPFNYNPNVPMDAKLNRDARQSFFSGHTSMVATMAISTAVIWSRYHPNSKWKPAVWTGAIAIPVTVAAARVRGGKHFLTDVGTGLLVGTATGWLIPYINRANR